MLTRLDPFCFEFQLVIYFQFYARNRDKEKVPFPFPLFDSCGSLHSHNIFSEYKKHSFMINSHNILHFSAADPLKFTQRSPQCEVLCDEEKATAKQSHISWNFYPQLERRDRTCAHDSSNVMLRYICKQNCFCKYLHTETFCKLRRVESVMSRGNLPHIACTKKEATSERRVEGYLYTALCNYKNYY